LISTIYIVGSSKNSLTESKIDQKFPFREKNSSGFWSILAAARNDAMLIIMKVIDALGG